MATDDASGEGALFEPDGDHGFLPTAAAMGPWSQSMLHGAAVSALAAGLLEVEDQVLARVLVELLGPVPHERLVAEHSPTEGGRRVVRQSVELRAGDRPVVRAHAVRMRRAELELPEAATAHPVVFDPATAPPLDRPNERATATIGWPSFDSLAMATKIVRREHGSPDPVRMWMQLLVPVVAGRPASAVEGVVAAADFGTAGSFARLDFHTWTYLNADLVVSFGRPPVPGWVGLECDGLLGVTGTGQSIAAIHDAQGRVAQSSQSLLVERRPS